MIMIKAFYYMVLVNMNCANFSRLIYSVLGRSISRYKIYDTQLLNRSFRNQKLF